MAKLWQMNDCIVTNAVIIPTEETGPFTGFRYEEGELFVLDHPIGEKHALMFRVSTLDEHSVKRCLAFKWKKSVDKDFKSRVIAALEERAAAIEVEKTRFSSSGAGHSSFTAADIFKGIANTAPVSQQASDGTIEEPDAALIFPYWVTDFLKDHPFTDGQRKVIVDLAGFLFGPSRHGRHFCEMGNVATIHWDPTTPAYIVRSQRTSVGQKMKHAAAAFKFALWLYAETDTSWPPSAHGPLLLVMSQVRICIERAAVDLGLDPIRPPSDTVLPVATVEAYRTFLTTLGMQYEEHNMKGGIEFSWGSFRCLWPESDGYELKAKVHGVFVFTLLKDAVVQAAWLIENFASAKPSAVNPPVVGVFEEILGTKPDENVANSNIAEGEIREIKTDTEADLSGLPAWLLARMENNPLSKELKELVIGLARWILAPHSLHDDVCDIRGEVNIVYRKDFSAYAVTSSKTGVTQLLSHRVSTFDFALWLYAEAIANTNAAKSTELHKFISPVKEVRGLTIERTAMELCPVGQSSGMSEAYRAFLTTLGSLYDTEHETTGCIRFPWGIFRLLGNDACEVHVDSLGTFEFRTLKDAVIQAVEIMEDIDKSTNLSSTNTVSDTHIPVKVQTLKDLCMAAGALGDFSVEKREVTTNAPVRPSEAEHLGETRKRLLCRKALAELLLNTDPTPTKDGCCFNLSACWLWVRNDGCNYMVVDPTFADTGVTVTELPTVKELSSMEAALSYIEQTYGDKLTAD